MVGERSGEWKTGKTAMTQLKALVVIGCTLFLGTLGESLAADDATPSVDLDRQQESPAPVGPNQAAVPSAKSNDESVGDDATPTGAQRQAASAEDEKDEKDAQPTPTAPAEELFTPSEEISEDLAVPFPVDI